MINLLGDVRKLMPEAIKIRRHFHEYPEVSSSEFETAEYLKEKVRDLGLEIKPVAGTGFYAILDTGKPGKTLGLRTDIDALPIHEDKDNLKQNKNIVSKNDGVSHACGHDAHMAILLTSMELLVQYKNELKGKIIFIFEEGEETEGGIGAMVDALKKESVDAIYGNHVIADMDTGVISVDQGPILAGASEFEFKILGKGGHGSRPDLAINPIFAAANVLMGISSAWNNRINVGKTVTLGIAQIHGGNQNNILPDEVFIGGTMRFFDQKEGAMALDMLFDVAKKIAEAHLCSFEITKSMTLIPLVNDDELALIAQKGIEELFPGSLIFENRQFASETFARYIELCPIVFSFVGMKNEQLGSGGGHHTPEFDVDEESLFYGVGSMVKFAKDYLQV